MSPEISSIIAGSLGGAIGVGVAFPLDTLKTKSQVFPTNKGNMWSLIQLIYEQEGLEGFYGGVRTMMIGQALIKAMAFATNSNMLLLFQNNQEMSPLLQLVIAASVSGFVTSFAVAPF